MWHLETSSYPIIIAGVRAGKIPFSYSTMQLGLRGTMNVTKNAGILGGLEPSYMPKQQPSCLRKAPGS